MGKLTLVYFQPPPEIVFNENHNTFKQLEQEGCRVQGTGESPAVQGSVPQVDEVDLVELNLNDIYGESLEVPTSRVPIYRCVAYGFLPLLMLFIPK